MAAAARTAFDVNLVARGRLFVYCLPEGDLKFSLTNLNCISYVKSQRLLSFPKIYLISQSSKQKNAEINLTRGCLFVSCLPEGDLKFSLTNLNCISYVKSQRLLSFPTIYLISQSSKQKIAEIMRKKEESRNL